MFKHKLYILNRPKSRVRCEGLRDYAPSSLVIVCAARADGTRGDFLRVESPTYLDPETSEYRPCHYRGLPHDRDPFTSAKCRALVDQYFPDLLVPEIII